VGAACAWRTVLCDARGGSTRERSFLEGMADTWTDLNSFMFHGTSGGIWLCSISVRGANEKVLELYDRQCWGIAQGLLRRIKSARYRCLHDWRSPASMSAPRWQDLAVHLVARAPRYGAAISHASIPVRLGAGGASGKRIRCWNRCGATPRPRPSFTQPRGMAGCRAARFARGCMPTLAGDYNYRLAPLGLERAANGRGAGGKRSMRNGISSKQILLDTAVKRRPLGHRSTSAGAEAHGGSGRRGR